MIETALMKVGAWEWPFMARLSEILGSLEMATFKPVESIVDRVDRLLSQGADWAWTVEELASSMKLSPRALTLQMKALTGEAPGHYIRKYRISAATRLLAMGLNVRETADRLGFANPYHFSRLYKEVTGESPSTAADRLAKEVGRSPLH
jgi:AraC-like DNA-binding protein